MHQAGILNQVLTFHVRVISTAFYAPKINELTGIQCEQVVNKTTFAGCVYCPLRLRIIPVSVAAHTCFGSGPEIMARRATAR